MASGPEIATAYLTLVPSLKGAGKTIGRELDGSAVRTAADRAGKNAGSRMGAGLKAGIGVALAGISVGAIASFATDAVASFSELEDSSAAAGVVFGKNMGAIIKQSQGASKTMGLSQQQVIAAANTFGTYGKAAGLSGKELASFATEQTALAADMASFKGTSPEQAIEAIGAALRGEMEPIRSYGVLLDDNTLRQEAFKMGLINTTKDALTPQQKTLAAQSAIFKQTTDAQGDFARTSQSTANVAKTLTANSENLRAKIGQQLAPAFTAVRKTVNDVMARFSGLIDQWKNGEGAAGRLRTIVERVGAALADTGRWLAEHKTLVFAVLGAWAAIRAGLAIWRGVQAAIALVRAVQLGYVAATYGVAGANLVAGNSAKVYTALTKAQAIGSRLAAAGQWLLNAAMSANPIGLIIAGIVLLVAGLVWFFTKTKVGQKIIQVAWGAIQGAVKAVVDWWKNTALPAIKRFFGGISKTVGNVVDWVKKNWPLLLGIITGPIGLAVLLVIRNWSKIKGAFVTVWDWVKKNVFDKISAFFGKGGPLRTTFANVVTAIATIFSGIQGKLRGVWDWVKKNVFDRITGFLGKGGPLRTAFSKVKDAIGTIWDGLKKLAAKPINFVLETVYNDGIRAWVGKLFGFFNKKNPLPKATPIAFAQGSEDHRAQIARGGAMRLWAEPETGGEAYIPLAASKRGRSTEILSRVASKFGYGLTQYAGGGFFGEAADFLRGPIDYVKDKAGAVINDKFGNRSGGMWDLVKEMPRMLVGPLATYAKNKLASIFGGGGGKYDGKAAGAIGWQRQWDIVKKAFPTATLNSAYRPGAITAVGTPSYHGLGRAIDVSPRMDIFNWLAKSFPGSTELIFSPANNRQLYKGRNTLFGEPTRGDHWDHIHWAMRNGGILPGVYDRGGWLPAGGVGVNLTGRPEAVLSPAESAGLKAGLGNQAPMVGTMITADPHAAIRELEAMQRRAAVRAGLSGRR